MSNPLARDSGSVSDGEKIFSSMNCDGCHGGGATGWVGPSLVDGRWRYGGSPGALDPAVYLGPPRGHPGVGGLPFVPPHLEDIHYQTAPPHPGAGPHRNLQVPESVILMPPRASGGPRRPPPVRSPSSATSRSPT